MKVHRIIPSRLFSRSFAPEAFDRCPGLNERAVHAEPILRQQLVFFGLFQNLLKKRSVNVSPDQAFLILGKSKIVPYPILNGYAPKTNEIGYCDWAVPSTASRFGSNIESATTEISKAPWGETWWPSGMEVYLVKLLLDIAFKALSAHDIPLTPAYHAQYILHIQYLYAKVFQQPAGCCFFKSVIWFGWTW